MPRDRSNTCSSTSTLAKRRPSYISTVSITPNDDLLITRTPKSISKSRRSSIVAELHDPPRSPSRRSSIASSQILLAPSLLSNSTNAYIQEIEIHENTIKKENKGRHRSSSVTSILTSAALANPLPSVDVHALYKIRNNKTSRKLDSFFGELAPHDICIKEIRKEGLKAMLASKVPMCYFLFHLLEEYSSENLFFFIELEQYESFTYSSPTQQFNTAHHICNIYLTQNSHFEVNLDEKVRRLVVEALEKKEYKNCFEVAKQAVYSMLESSFSRYLNSPTFEEMVSVCGELTTHYNNETRAVAVNKLIAFIEQQYTGLYKGLQSDAQMPMNLWQISRRRHELIKSMIHEFCRILVGIEFSYYRPEPSALLAEPNSMINNGHVNNKRTTAPAKSKDVFDFFGKKK